MNDVNLEQYLKIINEEKKKKGLDNYTPLYPMLRYENNKLYIGVLLTLNTNNVWDQNANIKPEYWALIDPQTNQVISINQTEEKDFGFFGSALSAGHGAVSCAAGTDGDGSEGKTERSRKETGSGKSGVSEEAGRLYPGRGASAAV